MLLSRQFIKLVIRLEDLPDRLAGALCDLSSPFNSTNPDVLTGRNAALSDIGGTLYRVQCCKVDRPFACPCGYIACTLGRPFCNIAAATTDLSASTLAVLVRFRLCGG